MTFCHFIFIDLVILLDYSFRSYEKLSFREWLAESGTIGKQQSQEFKLRSY